MMRQGEPLGALKKRITELEGKLAEETERLLPDYYDALRAGTPGPNAAVRAFGNTKTTVKQLINDAGEIIDVTSERKAILALEDMSADDIYPVSKILHEPGFNLLTRPRQLELLELADNYFVLSKAANSSKGSLTMAEWFKTEIGSKIPLEWRQPLLDAEQRAVASVKKYISDRVPPAARAQVSLGITMPP